MNSDYFIICGVLFGMYCTGRVIYPLIFWLDGKADRPMNSALDHVFPPSEWTGKPIDTSALSNRLQNVRKRHTAPSVLRGAAFKRAMEVKEQQEKLAQLAFFHPAPPPVEEEHGSLLLV